jgi:HD domain
MLRKFRVSDACELSSHLRSFCRALPQIAKERCRFASLRVTARFTTAWRSPPKTRTALDYARRLHKGQRRAADGAPFILHPQEVAALLAEAGARDDLIAAGALHDVIEKTPALACDVRVRFGTTVAALVEAVSENPRIAGYAARKAALRSKVAAAGEDALLLLAADKISKARELRLISGRDCADAGRPRRARRRDARQLAHYRGCLRLLEERLPGSPLVSLLAAELAKSGVRASRPALPARREARRTTRTRPTAAKRPLTSPTGASTA